MIDEKKFLDAIKTGKEIGTLDWYYISLDAMLQVDENGVSYLEHMCSNHIKPQGNIERIRNCITTSPFRTVRHFDGASRIPAPRAAHVHPVAGFSGQTDHVPIPAKSPRQGPRRGGDVARRRI